MTLKIVITQKASISRSVVHALPSPKSGGRCRHADSWAHARPIESESLAGGLGTLLNCQVSRVFLVNSNILNSFPCLGAGNRGMFTFGNSWSCTFLVYHFSLCYSLIKSLLKKSPPI